MQRSLLTHATAALVAGASLLFGLAACDEENTDLVITRDLPAPVDTVVVDDPISLLLVETETRRVSSGTAYFLVNGENTGYVLGSETVSVDCPGSLMTEFDGADDFFLANFIETPGGAFVQNASFNADVDGGTRTLTTLGVPPTCLTAPLAIDYANDGERVAGTIRGEFFYRAPVYVEPFDNCDNWVSVGEVEVAFDLPLRSCN